MRIELRVNGVRREADVHGAESLLFVLRERLGLPGAKGACEEGECGSCSVLMDGQLVCSCLVHGAQADGRSVTTIEGLEGDRGMHAVQRAFVAAGAVQCGFCTPGLVISAVALLARDPAPADDDIREALAGNLCRCTGYGRILDAVRTAAAELRA
jgi:carbon-monoxide dehydrogenase small subunit